MDCQQAGERLSCYLDREVEAAEQREVERHLDICPECRLHLEELERNRALLANLPRLRPPADMFERVLREARTSRPTVLAARPVARLRAAPWRIARGALAAAAAVVLLCLLALPVLGYYSEDPGLRVAAQPVVNRHALESGGPLLGEPPLWTTASYSPGHRGYGR